YTKIKIGNSLHSDWYWLGEWLHQKLGLTGKEALYFSAQSKGWPLDRKTCEVILTECLQCRLKLQTRHPAKAPPPHINQGKTLWSGLMPPTQSRFSS
uniref:Uncharacterized protein n=1 Tax=Aquila chrysaetos chrysaetos TaxID=223781 RepID=A0A663DWQ8_AQUCH